jgi:hypothetical protein
MIRFLVFLMDLLTDSQMLAALALSLFSIGCASTAIALLLGGFELARRLKLRRDIVATSRA